MCFFTDVEIFPCVYVVCVCVSAWLKKNVLFLRGHNHAELDVLDWCWFWSLVDHVIRVSAVVMLQG